MSNIAVMERTLNIIKYNSMTNKTFDLSILRELFSTEFTPKKILKIGMFNYSIYFYTLD